VKAQTGPRGALCRWFVPAWKAVYRRPWLLFVLPLAVFFPLLDSRGLYEFADANFPLHPFWIDYILPWSGAASAGADNTFVGVPRLIYHVVIDVLIATFHNLQVAQWLWYSAMVALGLSGAFLLARRLGAGPYSVPLAIFYALNLWSYDRIAQSLIFLSYQALPLAVYLLLRYLKKPGVDSALYFACSLLLVIPSPQVSYLAAVICIGIALREVILRGWRVALQLGALAIAVVAANAFYVFTMAADTLLNSGGDIALVNQRFNLGAFEHYSQRVGIFNTLRLASFYYSTIDRQSAVVQVAVTLIPVLLVGLLLLARRPTLRSRFYCGLSLALLGIWLVSGIVLAPALFSWFRLAVPGLRSFAEPDYFSPLYIFGAFVMLAAGVRPGVRAYQRIFAPRPGAPNLMVVVVWFVALAGIVPFLPLGGGMAGMPQTGQPRQYAEFALSHVQGNTLWLPPDRDVQYRWSAYPIHGFTSLNSPSDALGPTMLEWVSTGTERVQRRLALAFEMGQDRTVRALAPLLNVGTIAIAGDSMGPNLEWPNAEVTGSLETFNRLARAGFITSRNDYKDVGVHLVTGTTKPPLPELGIFDSPVTVGGFENFIWWSIARGGANYAPVAADLPDGQPVGGVTLRAMRPPPVSMRAIPIGAFTSFARCAANARNLGLPKGNRPLTVSTDDSPRCAALELHGISKFAAIDFAIDGTPSDLLRPELAFSRKGGDARHADMTLPIQEVPGWAQRGVFTIEIPPNTDAVVRGASLQWLVPRRAKQSRVVPPTCSASNVRWSERNPLEYTVEGNVHGRCTVVFRQSFAPIWELFGNGSAKVLGHLQIDGFANGWIVEGSGPATFRVINLLIYPYLAGLVLTGACLLLTIGFAVRAWFRRGLRSASRVPSPA
jgi:hypothetical protein